MTDWLFNTKVGHFLFLFVLSEVLNLLFCIILFDMEFFAMASLGSFISSIFLVAYFDENEKLY